MTDAVTILSIQLLAVAIWLLNDLDWISTAWGLLSSKRFVETNPIFRDIHKLPKSKKREKLHTMATIKILVSLFFLLLPLGIALGDVPMSLDTTLLIYSGFVLVLSLAVHNNISILYYTARRRGKR